MEQKRVPVFTSCYASVQLPSLLALSGEIYNKLRVVDRTEHPGSADIANDTIKPPKLFKSQATKSFIINVYYYCHL